MLTPDQIQQAADDLYQAEVRRQAIDPVTLSHPDMDMDDAYAIQKCWIDKKVADGRRVRTLAKGEKRGWAGKTVSLGMMIGRGWCRLLGTGRRKSEIDCAPSESQALRTSRA